jgi:hypothetical protein
MPPTQGEELLRQARRDSQDEDEAGEASQQQPPSSSEYCRKLKVVVGELRWGREGAPASFSKSRPPASARTTPPRKVGT